MQTRQLALKAYCPNKYSKVEVKQSKRSTVGYSILFYLYVQQNLLLYYWDPLSRKKAVLPSCCYCFFFSMPAENLPPYGLEVQSVLLLRFCEVEPKKVTTFLKIVWKFQPNSKLSWTYIPIQIRCHSQITFYDAPLQITGRLQSDYS